MTGFFITPWAFGARVELNEHQLELYGQDDDETSEEPIRDNNYGNYLGRNSFYQEN